MTKTINSYDDIEVTTNVMTASNHRLIQLLMNKCLQHIETAKKHMLNNDIASKGHSIKKAMDILDYLRVCLNFSDKRAHELSSQLDSIYAYLENTLLKANIKNDVTYLDEVKKLICIVKEGWDEIGEKTE